MNPVPINILIVDDAILVMKQLSKLLHEVYSFNSIRFASNAEDGIAAFDQEIPQVLILDINLPGMSGVEMLKLIKKKPALNLLIIMLTNTSFATYKEECLKIGADYFLDKSRDFILLPELIDQYMHHKIASNSC